MHCALKPANEELQQELKNYNNSEVMLLCLTLAVSPCDGDMWLNCALVLVQKLNFTTSCLTCTRAGLSAALACPQILLNVLPIYAVD